MNGEPLVLIVDDDAGTRKVCQANLALEGFEVLTAACGAEALEVLARADPLVAVFDLKMPDMTGIQLMERARELRPSLPTILATAHATVDTAVEAMRRGALHYLTKPIQFDELALLLRKAVEGERSRRDVVRLRGELERASGFEEVVHGSEQMEAVLRLVEQVAGSDATVLVRGETGTGKELVARAIHRLSARRELPFVAVNCSAIPRELMESEFFGHEKGAFTGAAGRRAGRFEQAAGSTLFLDEVGELDLAMQAKLLRVLQEREFTRVGGERALKADVRVVAATNRDLEGAVRAGTFRDDLYYRLNVIPLHLPPLRERGADVERLMEHFLASYAQRCGRPAVPPPPALREAARAYAWPGNVRELRNVCERAVLMGWASVEPILLASHRPDAPSLAALVDLDQPLLEARAALVDRFEREYLTRLLSKHEGRVGEVARAAGLAERNLYEKLQRYGLNRQDFKKPAGAASPSRPKDKRPRPEPLSPLPLGEGQGGGPPEARAQPTPAPLPARRTLLVVDDSPTARTLLRGLLADATTDILEAADGEEALALVRARRVDAAIVDQRMPRVTGLEFVQRVRAAPGLHTLPILVVTGDADGGIEHALQQGGADAVLRKPFSGARLRQELARLTGGPRP